MKREPIDILKGRAEEFEARLRKAETYWRAEAEQYRRSSLVADPAKADRSEKIADMFERVLEEPKLKVLTVADILQAPSVAWQIENVLPDAVLTILAGYTGIGKSLLALSLAGAIASGQPLFGKYKIKRCGPVLIVDQENGVSLLQERLKAARLQDASIFFLSFSGVLLDRPRSFELLLQAIEKVKPVQVFFDSLIRFHRVDENSASEMAQVLGRLREIVNLGIGVMALHHHGKSKGSPETRARGSSDIIGGADLELSLEKNKDTLELHTVKTRWLTPDPMSLKIETKAEGAVITYLGPVEPHGSDRKKREEVILSAETPLTIQELLERLDEAELSISERSLRPILKKLIGTGKLKETTGPHNMKTYQPVRF